MTQPTGVGTFFLFYTGAGAGAGGARRKLRLGEYHPENYTLREARAAAIEAMAAINRGSDPVAEVEAKEQAQTFKALAEQFFNDAPHLGRHHAEELSAAP